MAAPTAVEDSDAFKRKFKYFKRKHPLPDFTTVIDFDNEDKFGTVCQRTTSCLVDCDNHIDAKCERLGLRPVHTWKSFSIVGYEGSYFVCNPFTQSGQRFWAEQCLAKYPRKPNVTNLDGDQSVKDVDGMWDRHVANCNELDLRRGQLSKLRWATLGYHHDWNSKVYDLESSSPFPDDLSSLAKLITDYLGFSDYKAEAAIVNYYTMSSNIGGHTDHSEPDHQSPLVSISFGQSAVFLLEPIAMYLKSGDIVIMSGPTRLCYHAVPRVVATTLHTPWKDDEVAKTDVDPVTADDDVRRVRQRLCDYLAAFRININIRQVFPSVNRDQAKRVKLR